MEGAPMTVPLRTDAAVSEELVEAMCAAHEAAIDEASKGIGGYGPRELDGWQHIGFRAALNAIAPRIKAEGLREAEGYAERLAVALWERLYKHDTPHWKPLSGDLI